MARRQGQVIPKGPNIWLVRVYMGRDGAGVRRYRNHTVRGTKRDASAYLNKVLREKDLGEFVEPTRQTLGEFAEEWIKTGVTGKVRAKTAEDYRGLLTRYVLPSLSGRRLRDISALDLDRVYAAMQAKGLSNRTVRYTHAVVNRCFQAAVEWQLLSKSPAKSAHPPRKERREMGVLTPDQVKVFLDEAQSDKWYALWLLLVWTGLRPNEALALKWGDVEDGKVVVQRKLSRTPSGGWSFESPKTDKSRRSVSIPRAVSDELRSHKARQNAERLLAGSDYNDIRLVFAGAQGSPLDYRNLIKRHFKKILERAGLPAIRPYDVRHTSATLMLAANTHPKVVSARLGHSTVGITLDVYSHVLPELESEALEKVEILLNRDGVARQIRT